MPVVLVGGPQAIVSVLPPGHLCGAALGGAAWCQGRAFSGAGWNAGVQLVCTGPRARARNWVTNPGCNYLVRGYGPSMHFFQRAFSCSPPFSVGQSTGQWSAGGLHGLVPSYPNLCDQCRGPAAWCVCVPAQ